MFRSIISRLVSLLFVFTILVMPACAAETAPDNSIKPVLLSIFDQTASVWYESQANRSLLATAVWVDISLSDKEYIKEVAENAVMEGEVYVAIDEQQLVIVFFTPEAYVIAVYNHDKDSLVAGVTSNESRWASSSDYMEAMLNLEQFSSYYEIYAEDIFTFCKTLLKVLSGE